jgi:DNA polymerase-1
MTTDFKKYGWKLNETNLSTLPEDAPTEIRALTKWLTLEGRRSSLEKWIECVEDDGRIHGKFWHIGAWTHRKSHSNPNQANIASVYNHEFQDELDDKWYVEIEGEKFGPFDTSDEARLYVPGGISPVGQVKTKFDGRLRELFHAPEGAWLVGTDADGIQLRILAHYMESESYRDAIFLGKKEDETDIHNVNKRALGGICRDRDTAKTFIYAWLLGAGLYKIADILGTTVSSAALAVDAFLASLPELKKLKEYKIPKYAARGYFIGIDGRKVPCNSEYLMLAGMLQSGEAIAMKLACAHWHAAATKAGYKFELVDDVHDEWQTIVYGDIRDAEAVGKLQREAIEYVGKELDLFCPLAGSTTIGKNWRETH